VTIGGASAERGVTNGEIDSLVASMTGADPSGLNVFAAAAYTVDPKDMDSFQKDDETKAAMGYDFIFRSDGSNAGDDSGWGSYSGLNPDSEQVSCDELTGATDPDSLFQLYRRSAVYRSTHSDPDISDDARQQLDIAAQNVLAVFGAGLDSPTYYRCHWANHNDTQADALVAFDDSGKVDVVVGFAGSSFGSP
jgi:hypothetical protein